MQTLNDAIKLLGVYTAGRFDIWMLSGSSRASCRAHVMSALQGNKVPQSKAGINALRESFYTALNIEGTCLAEREDRFITECRKRTS